MRNISEKSNIAKCDQKYSDDYDQAILVNYIFHTNSIWRSNYKKSFAGYPMAVMINPSAKNTMSRQAIIARDGEVGLYNDYLDEKTAGTFFAIFKNTIAWRQDAIRIYGRSVDIPRLTAWYAVAGKSYRYSGITLQPQSWTCDLLVLREQLQQFLEADFNSVLLNYYRNGNDRVGWHSDDERDLAKNSTIAAISLGTARRFLIRHKHHKEEKIELMLKAGSLLIMQGSTQQYWQHCVPPAKRIAEPRISLTFRMIR
jgi:alkylated DNA repair dioxygenase AlkB